jgi:hypothetical protein
MRTHIVSSRRPTAVVSLVLLSAVAGCGRVKAHDGAAVAHSAPARVIRTADLSLEADAIERAEGRRRYLEN